MSTATRYTGKDLYVEFAGTSLTGDQRAFSVTMEQETADVTAGADGARVFKATVKNYGASLELLATTDGTATLAVIQPGDEGTLVWGPHGTTAGKEKWGFPAIVTNMSPTINFDDAVVYQIEFQAQGDLTYDGTTIVWP